MGTISSIVGQRSAGTTLVRHGQEHWDQLRRIAAEGDVAAVGLLPTRGNIFTLLPTAETYYASLIRDIGAASQQVNFGTFGMRMGEPGGFNHRLTGALKERASRPGDAIPVTVLADELGAGYGPGALIGAGKSDVATTDGYWESMRDSGIETALKPFRLGRGREDDSLWAIDHRKITEVDGSIGYSGGRNSIDSWDRNDDVVVRVEGPAVAQLGAVLAGRWRDTGRVISDERMQVLESGLRRPVDDAVEGMTRVLVNGNRHQRELTNATIEQMEQATGETWLLTQAVSDASLMRAFVDGAERGVSSHLFVSPNMLDPRKGWSLIRTDPGEAISNVFRKAWAARAISAGASVTVLPRHNHGKVLLTMDAERGAGIAKIGTLNGDRFAMRHNKESAVETSEPGLVSDLRSHLQSVEASGTPLREQDVPASWHRMWRVLDALGIEF